MTEHHTKALEELGKGYRYTWRVGSPNLYLTPPGPLSEFQSLATDQEINVWLDKLEHRGEDRVVMLADMAARRADVASGREDTAWSGKP